MKYLIALLLLMTGCVTRYESATISTLTPKSRITLLDESKVVVKNPSVILDSIYSSNARTIAMDSVIHFEREHATNSKDVQMSILGALMGLVIASQVK